MEKRIRTAAQKANRNPDEITLVLVTKTVSADRIREIYEAGARDFGENRVQEFLQKKIMLPADIRWHFVGHLQTNKVKSVVGETVLLHSLDRIELAEEIQKQAQKKNVVMDSLVQVNTTGEATKSGFEPEEVIQAMERIRKMNRIQLRGLMTIGPTPIVGAGAHACPENESIAIGQPRGVAPTIDGPARTCFSKLRLLRDELKQKFPDLALTELSMGMSSDFEMAIEEGATMVRIGTAVFGERE